MALTPHLSLMALPLKISRLPLSLYDGVRRVAGLHREFLVSVENPTDPYIPLKKRTPTLSKQTPTLSLKVLCKCSVHGTRNVRVGVLFCSGMWGSVLGSSRRLQVPDPAYPVI